MILGASVIKIFIIKDPVVQSCIQLTRGLSGENGGKLCCNLKPVSKTKITPEDSSTVSAVKIAINVRQCRGVHQTQRVDLSTLCQRVFGQTTARLSRAV